MKSIILSEIHNLSYPFLSASYLLTGCLTEVRYANARRKPYGHFSLPLFSEILPPQNRILFYTTPSAQLHEYLVARVIERSADIVLFQRIEESFIVPPHRRPLGRLRGRVLQMTGRTERHKIPRVVAAALRARNDVMHLQALTPIAAPAAAEVGIEHLAAPLAKDDPALLTPVSVPPQHGALHAFPYQAAHYVGRMVRIWQLPCPLRIKALSFPMGLTHHLQRRLG